MSETMERHIGAILAIKALGYPDSCCLSRCRCDELPCPLLNWLSAQIGDLCLECRDSELVGDVLLVRELRNLLSNMFSPLTELTSDLLEPSILNRVTEFLVSELQAAKIIKYKESHPEAQTPLEQPEKEQRVDDYSCEVTEFCQKDNDVSDKSRKLSEMQAEWILLLRALGMDVSSEFEDVLNEVKLRLSQLPGGEMTNPLLNSTLSSEQWLQVKKLNEVLTEDYRCRRQMMIKRFRVTIESFAWGEKTKECSEALASVPPLESLTSSSLVCPSLLLAAREDQSFIDPIKTGKRTPVYKMLMGNVPDRGGRPGEIEPPMPAWGERREKGNRWGRGGGQHHRPKKKKGKKE
ncbi:protein FAM98C [Pholidichthys leucotaenia]